jgi:membrane-associated phospholipid phosphatase
LPNARCSRGLRPRIAGFPALIAFWRTYVAAHYLSDVAGGAIIGAMAAFSVAIFLLPQIRNPPVPQSGNCRRRPGFQSEI